MLGDFLTEDFTEIADDLFEDGVDVQIVHSTGGTYDENTLTNTGATTEAHPTKLYFLALGPSNTIAFDREIKTEEFSENVAAVVSYRGDIEPGDKVTGAPGGDYTITGVAGIKPMGAMIVQRVKLSR